MWVAPKRRAHSSLRSSTSTATIVRAPARDGAGDGGVAHSAAAEHGDGVAPADPAGVDRGAEAGHDPAPDQAGRLRPGRGIHLDGLAGRHQGLLGEGPDPEGRRQRGAVRQRHGLGGVGAVEAVPRAAPPARPAHAARGPPGQHHVVAGRHVGHPLADRLDRAGRFVAEEEGEVVVDRPLAVVEVGVAHPAGLDRDQGLARAGIGHHHGLEADGRTLFHRDHAADLDGACSEL